MNNNKIVNSINTTFLVGIGIMIGFMIANLITIPTQFTMVSWAAIVAITAAMVSIFIDFVIQPGHIFGFWSRFLDSMNNPKNPFRAMAKPLGGCLYCMNVWVTFGTFILTKQGIGMSWWYLIPTAAISHVVLAIMERKVNA
jgi:hypothetical protein